MFGFQGFSAPCMFFISSENSGREHQGTPEAHWVFSHLRISHLFSAPPALPPSEVRGASRSWAFGEPAARIGVSFLAPLLTGTRVSDLPLCELVTTHPSVCCLPECCYDLLSAVLVAFVVLDLLLFLHSHHSRVWGRNRNKCMLTICHD